MASPQTEDGFTRIANELLTELCRTSLNGTQWAIVMAVVRLTYGYGKKTAQIGISRVAQITGKHRIAVAREMNRLLKMGILIESEPATFGKCRTVGINKDYETWTLTVNESVDCEQKHLHTVNGLVDRGVNESVDLPVNESVDHIKKVKKPLKKELKKEGVFLSDVEHSKLVEAHGEKRANRMYEILSAYKMSKGKKYKSDYHAILSWVIYKERERFPGNDL